MKLKTGFLALAVSAGAMAALPITASAQRRPPIETKGSTPRGTSAKADEPVNTKGKSIPAPPNKGGEKTRGAMVGELHVDNRTDLYIRIYSDDVYVGLVAPWGDWYGAGHCDAFKLEARAYFDNGTYRYWGPVVTSAGCGDQIWTLRP